MTWTRHAQRRNHAGWREQGPARLRRAARPAYASPQAAEPQSAALCRVLWRRKYT